MSARESFWDYSNRVYSNPHVAESCLTLQNLYGLDVNLLMFACWHARVQGPIEEETLQRAVGFSRQWAAQVVQPLRAARTWMKNAPEAARGREPARQQDFATLRQKIKAVELQAEKFQQYELEALVSRPAQPVGIAETHVCATAEVAKENLLAIIEASAVTLNDEIRALLTILLANVLGNPTIAQDDR